MKRLALGAVLALFAAPAFAQASGVGYSATQAATDNVVAKTIPATLYGLNVVSGANAGYVMVLDAKTVPGDGAVVPAKCLPLAANTGIYTAFIGGLAFRSGIVVAFSTTGCFTKTASATAFISVDAR